MAKRKPYKWVNRYKRSTIPREYLQSVTKRSEYSRQLGENIRQRRRLAGYTPETLAKLVGFPLEFLLEVEEGLPISATGLTLLCKALGVSPVSLLPPLASVAGHETVLV